MEIDIKTVIGSYAQITIFLLMFSVGLQEGFSNLSILWRRPALLIRCLIAALIVVPVAGIVILKLLPMMDPSARAALALMAVCPGAPLTYKKLAGMKANTAIAGSFQTTISLFAALFVPLWFIIFSTIFPRDATVNVTQVFTQVATVQFIPIVLGLAIRQWLPTLADDMLEPVRKICSLIFVGLVIVILVVALPKVMQVGVLNVAATVLFITIAILAGHYLGGPEPETRLAIGLANSTRNAGLALALATLNFGKDPGILAGIAAIALLAFIADAIYANLYRKQLAQEHPAMIEG